MPNLTALKWVIHIFTSPTTTTIINIYNIKKNKIVKNLTVLNKNCKKFKLFFKKKVFKIKRKFS